MVAAVICIIAVAVKPEHSAVTVISVPSNSTASALLNETTKALEAA